MPAPFLTEPDITALTDAAINADVFSIPRALQFQFVVPAFVHRLPGNPIPLVQFRLDLAALNLVDRLEDGSVPLVLFLRNIASLLRPRVESAVFERYANKVGNQTQGVPALPAVAKLPEVVRKEAIVHQDDTVEFQFLTDALAVGKSVARVAVPRFDGGNQRMVGGGRPWIMNGTGWLVGPDLLITNHHVVNAREQGEPDASASDLDLQAKGITVSFDFDTATANTLQVGVSKLEAVNEALDYAVVRLAQSPNRKALAINKSPVTVVASTYLPVNIIQHPRGSAKRIAFRNNLVSGADGETIRYFTDTDYGSSGSPVCDDAWRVVALHRGAEEVQNVQFQGKSTAYVNFGSQIQTILHDLTTRAAAVHAEIAAGQH
jgi:endonuclease G, mitochondrial